MTEEFVSDRRKHPRAPVGVTVDFLANGQASNRCSGAIEELSDGGMSFKSTAVLEEGALLYLKLHPLEIRGEIRSIRALHGGAMRRYGVRFHKIIVGPSPRAKDIIDMKAMKSKRN